MNSAGNSPFFNPHSTFGAKRHWENDAGTGSAQIPIFEHQKEQNIMYIYILKCSDNSLYTGIAANIEKRIRQHLGIIKGGAKYTKSHRPVSVEALWYTENANAARKLEAAIKKLAKADKIRIVSSPEMIFSDYLPDLAEFDFSYIGTDALNNSIFK